MLGSIFGSCFFLGNYQIPRHPRTGLLRIARSEVDLAVILEAGLCLMGFRGLGFWGLGIWGLGFGDLGFRVLRI